MKLEFENLTQDQIEIRMLKSKIENLEFRIDFLDKHLIQWMNIKKLYKLEKNG